MRREQAPSSGIDAPTPSRAAARHKMSFHYSRESSFQQGRRRRSLSSFRAEPCANPFPPTPQPSFHKKRRRNHLSSGSVQKKTKSVPSGRRGGLGKEGELSYVGSLTRMLFAQRDKDNAQAERAGSHQGMGKAPASRPAVESDPVSAADYAEPALFKRRIN